MAKTRFEDEEIEKFRQKELAKQLYDLSPEEVKDREDRFNPEPFGFGHHEALHTAFVQMEVWDSYVMEHPSVVNDPELFRQAWRAHEEMWEMYQLLGAKQK